MDLTAPQEQTWTVVPAPVGSVEAGALLRDYYTAVADRHFELHQGRKSTPQEVELLVIEAEAITADLGPPTGMFLMGSFGDEPAAFAGLRVAGVHTVELTNIYVHPAVQGTGGADALLAIVDEAAMGLGAERIVLDSHNDLAGASEVYAQHGYTEIPPVSDRGHSDPWYSKKLSIS